MTRKLRFSTQAGSARPVETFGLPREPSQRVEAIANDASVRQWTDRARRLERMGYSALLIPDHVIGTQLWSVFPALAAAAMATTTLRVGTLVIANDFRNPVLLAREFATLDLVSAGRVEMGIGAGWAIRDYETLGIGYDRGGVRVERLEEAVTLIKRLFAEDEVTHEGRYYRTLKAQLAPTPIQRPHPPLAIAGGGKRILSLAGREADIAAIVSMTTETGGVRDEREVTFEAAVEKVSWVRSAAGDRFGDIELSMFLDITLTDDPERYVAELAKRLDRPPELITRSVYRVVGSADDVRKRVLRMREIGITYFCIRGAHVEELGSLVKELSGT